MEKIRIKNITLMDKTETREAYAIYNSKRANCCLIFIIPIIISSLLLLCVANNPEQMGDGGIGMLFVLTIILTLINIGAIYLYRNVMRPYKDLLEVAKLNDRVRHEEKIRFKERKRIEEYEKNFILKKRLKKQCRKF